MKTWHWLLLGGLAYWLYSKKAQGTALVGPDVQYDVHPVTGQSVPAGTVQPAVPMAIAQPAPITAGGSAIVPTGGIDPGTSFLSVLSPSAPPQAVMVADPGFVNVNFVPNPGPINLASMSM